MQGLLSTYVRARGIEPLEVPGGVAFADPSDPGHVMVRLLAVNAPRASNRHLVTVRAEYAFEDLAAHAHLNGSVASNQPALARPPTSRHPATASRAASLSSGEPRGRWRADVRPPSSSTPGAPHA